MPSKSLCRSNESIIEALTKKSDKEEAYFKSLTRNALVKKGHALGVLNDQELRSSLLYDTTVIKSYLWTFIDDSIHRCRVREYVLQCNKLQQRAYFTLKTAYFACASGELGSRRFNESTFVSAILDKPLEAFCYIVLPEHFNENKTHPIRDIIDSVKVKYPLLDDFADINALRDVATQSGFDNTKKYIATKLRTAVFNHITVHLYRRIRGSMHSRRISERTEVNGMMELFMTGFTKKTVGKRDRHTVVNLRRVFLSDEDAMSENVPLPPIPTTNPTHQMTMLHLECCRLAIGTDGEFSPFPNASLGRNYQRLCTRIAQYVLQVENFEVAFHLGYESSKKRGKLSRTIKHNRRNCKRNGYFTIGTTERSAFVSSIETDGVGVSIVVSTERLMNKYKTKYEPRTEAQKRKYAEEKRSEEVSQLQKLLPRAIVKGLDPGRVSLYTTAEEKEDDTFERRFYSRNRHLEKSGRKRMKAWREERTAIPVMVQAMKELSLTAGSHGCNGSAWISYVNARHANRRLLWREFLYNDERYKKRMVEVRLGRRALARAADNLIMEGLLQNRPVIIGYGTGRGNGGGHKGEASVPVKAMYRELKMAFKRHRVEGGVLDVWEHYTTQKCHRCEKFMATRIVPWTLEDIEKQERRNRRKYEQISAREVNGKEERRCQKELKELAHPDPPLNERMKRDRDFRVCEHCSYGEQTKKTRNRDFNAAINILKITNCELQGERRPIYLCPEAKRKREGKIISEESSSEKQIESSGRESRRKKTQH